MVKASQPSLVINMNLFSVVFIIPLLTSPHQNFCLPENDMNIFMKQWFSQAHLITSVPQMIISAVSPSTMACFLLLVLKENKHIVPMKKFPIPEDLFGFLLYFVRINV